MALQKSVGLNQALGVAGQEVVVGQAIYTAKNYLSDGTVKAGNFAFEKAVSGNGVPFDYVTLSMSAGFTFAGFVERTQTGAITNETLAFTDTYPEGQPVTIALKGQFYVKAPSSASGGEKVFVGSSGMYFASSASSQDDVDTGFTVILPTGVASAAKDDIVIIQKV